MKCLASSTCVALLAAGLPMAAAAAPSNGCAPFQDIDHCPVGGASLMVADDGSSLMVGGMGPGGEDGVISSFAPTVFWIAQIQFPDGNGGDDMHLSSISGGEVTSELSIEPTANGYRLGASFTGDAQDSTFSVMAYRNGVFQHGVGGVGARQARVQPLVDGAAKPGLTSTGEAIAVYVDGMYWGELDLDWPWWIGFSINSAGGGCNWGIQRANAARLTFPDGTAVMADEVRVMEEIRGSGHYPYLGFESIAIQSRSESFKITSELAEGNR